MKVKNHLNVTVVKKNLQVDKASVNIFLLFMKERDYSNATVVKRVLLRVQILTDTKLQSMMAKKL